MIRRPPRSTLFPLHDALPISHASLLLRDGRASAERHDPPGRQQERGARSEEHTSELQSLAYLVCRLLLEKKKKNRSQYETVECGSQDTLQNMIRSSSTHLQRK